MEDSTERSSKSTGETKYESSRPDWRTEDPIVMLATDTEAQTRFGSMGRFRSLTRPNRPSISTPKRDLLALDPPDESWTPWKVFYTAVTCCIPEVLLERCGGMMEAEKQRAWREKVALCFICFMMMIGLGFLTFGLQAAICQAEKNSFMQAQVQQFTMANNPNYLIIRGVVYQMGEATRKAHQALPYFLSRPKETQEVNNAVGDDISKYFPVEKNPVCLDKLKQFSTCQTADFTSNHCHLDTPATRFFFKDSRVGPIYYTWDQIRTSNTLLVFSGMVLDLKPLLDANAKPFGDTFDKVMKESIGTDATHPFASLPDGSAYGQCLVNAFAVGRLDAITPGCWASQVVVWVGFIIIMGLIAIRFILAVMFRWGMSTKLGRLEKNYRNRKPLRRNTIADGKFAITMMDSDGKLIARTAALLPSAKNASLPRRMSQKRSQSNYGHEVHTMLLVTCYSEDRDSLKLTLDSLAATDYNEDYKMLVVIADGLIKGAGNDKSTPELLLELIEVDENWDEPEPKSYLALAEGSRQHNMAKVYAGWYNYQDRSVPTVVIIKCGTPQETAKPGNRGKRDSQMILMRFLERVTFNQRMCPLEYDMFQKMHYLMGVTPDFFEIVLMVDADTKVAPDSLARMVACMVDDPLVMGLCGETRIANKNDSWVSRIQVFEYYLSHHMTKAFESMFGLVTCLPGCFCMYRIKARKGADSWTPILCSPEIINTYSQTVVDTLHKKNLLLLGEDRFLTTLMLRTFPQRKLIFVPRAYCKTTVPNTFKVLLSQRRRWINSTIHNLLELILVNELCGIFCCSMQFAIFLELIGTVTLPAAIVFTFLLIIVSIVGEPQIVPLILLAGILGLPAILILLTTRRVVYIYWMFVYLLALPIWNFVLPAYAFWHFDDFTWGQTRKVENEKPGHISDTNRIDGSDIPLRRWADWERDRRAAMVIAFRRRNSFTQQVE